MAGSESTDMTGDISTSVEILKQRVRDFCEARDWDRFHGAKDLAIGVITEAAELLEHFRFCSEEEVASLFERPEQRKEIEAEIADVLIFLLRLAQRYDIDLSEAVRAKLAHNEKRYPVDSLRGINAKAGRGRS